MGISERLCQFHFNDGKHGVKQKRLIIKRDGQKKGKILNWDFAGSGEIKARQALGYINTVVTWNRMPESVLLKLGF